MAKVQDLLLAHIERATLQMSEFLARDLYRPAAETNVFRRVWERRAIRKGGRRRGKILRHVWKLVQARFDTVVSLNGLQQVLGDSRTFGL